MKRTVWGCVVAVALLCPAARARAADAPTSVVVRAARMIDGVSDAVLTPGVVVITGDRIVGAGASASVPAGATTIDLGDVTLLPGLIDCHTHLSHGPGPFYERIFRRSPIDMAITAHVNARRTLDAGFTTIRDLGADEYIDVALHHAIDRGEIPGPRMLCATLAVGSTGGHNDLSGFTPYLDMHGFTGVADGPDEIRKLVRTEIKNGADVIKMIATAGVLSEEESVGAPQYSEAEMRAVVDEAAMYGRKVAAHAHGAEGIKRATRAGVASIEHCTLVDAEGITLMKKHGTYDVPTLYVVDYVVAEYGKLGYPERILEKARALGHQARDNFRLAVQGGVKYAFGTDAGVFPHGTQGREFKILTESGLTPMQAIRAATVNAADLLGWSDKVGRLAPGRYADVIAVTGNPLADITTLEHPVFVMKGGEVFRQDR